jgi:uncharacterized membrane protein
MSLTILALIASPLFAQSLPERLAAVERNNAALADAVARVEADVATIKMNTNAMAAKVDALDAKVERLIRAQPAASQAWTSSPVTTSAWSEAPAASSGWSSSSSAPMARPRLFGRLRGGSCGAGG